MRSSLQAGGPVLSHVGKHAILHVGALHVEDPAFTVSDTASQLQCPPGSPQVDETQVIINPLADLDYYFGDMSQDAHTIRCDHLNVIGRDNHVHTLKTSISKKVMPCGCHTEVRVTGFLLFTCDCDTEYITDINEYWSLKDIVNNQFTGTIDDYGLRMKCNHKVIRSRFIHRRGFCHCTTLMGDHGSEGNKDDVSDLKIPAKDIKEAFGCQKGCKQIFHYHKVSKEKKEGVTPAAKAFYEREKKRTGGKEVGAFYLCEYLTKDCSRVARKEIHYHALQGGRSYDPVSESLLNAVEGEQGIEDALNELSEMFSDEEVEETDANNVSEPVVVLSKVEEFSSTTVKADIPMLDNNNNNTAPPTIPQLKAHLKDIRATHYYDGSDHGVDDYPSSDDENAPLLRNSKTDEDIDALVNMVDDMISSYSAESKQAPSYWSEEKMDRQEKLSDVSSHSSTITPSVTPTNIPPNNNPAPSEISTVSTRSSDPTRNPGPSLATHGSSITTKSPSAPVSSQKPLFDLGCRDRKATVVIFTSREKFQLKEGFFAAIGSKVRNLFYTNKEYDGLFNNANFDEVTEINQVENRIAGWLASFIFNAEDVAVKQTDLVSSLSLAYNGYYEGEVYEELTNFLLLKSMLDIPGPATSTAPYGYFANMIMNKMHELDDVTKAHYASPLNYDATINTIMHVVNRKVAIHCKTTMSLPRATNYGVPGLTLNPQDFR